MPEECSNHIRDRTYKTIYLEPSEKFDVEKEESALEVSLADAPPTALLPTPPPPLAIGYLCISTYNQRHAAPNIKSQL
ncbi:hypothetical protein ACLOJK_015531 [Asimina triloba]